MYLIDVKILNDENSAFKRLSPYISRLSMHWVSPDIFIAHLHGNMECLSIRSNSDKYRTLTSSYFSLVMKLEMLDMSNCGIEVIEENALNDIARLGLKTLILAGNRIAELKEHVAYSVLASFLVEFRIDVAKCDCDFYMWTAALDWRKALGHLSGDVACKDRPLAAANCSAVESLCAEKTVQTLHSQRICLANSSNAEYNYLRILIRVNATANQVTIETRARKTIRLWIGNNLDMDEYYRKWNHSPQKCPSRGFIKQSVKCYLLRNGSQTVPFAGDGIRILCANYIPRGATTFWPLHCAVHRQQSSDIATIDYLSIIVLPLCVALVACMTLTVVGVRLSTGNSTADATEAGSDHRASAEVENEYANIDELSLADGRFN